MKFLKLLGINLSLFDGGAGTGAAAGAAEGGGQAAAETSTQGETKASPESTRRGKKSGELSNVVYGKQPQAQSTAAQDAAQQSEKTDSAAGSEQEKPASAEDKRKAFRDLVNGEYKDIYTEETQRIIDRRFAESKNLEQQLSQNQPIIEALMQRYKIADGDVTKLAQAVENDDAYWSEAAEEAGMDVEQYKRLQKLQRENAALLRMQEQQKQKNFLQQQLQKWQGEADEVATQYEDFDFNTELRNPQFLSLLKSGVPVKHAYEVVHMDDIKQRVARSTAQQTQKQVVDDIRAKGSRPAENGTTSQSTFTIKSDPSKWSKKDRAEVARRVARGEKIEL